MLRMSHVVIVFVYHIKCLFVGYDNRKQSNEKVHTCLSVYVYIGRCLNKIILLHFNSVSGWIGTTPTSYVHSYILLNYFCM